MANIRILRHGDLESTASTTWEAIKTTFTGKEDLPVVASLDLNRFCGKWYEIARLPVVFESRLVNVQSEYTMMPDGKIRVINMGRKGSIQGELTTAEATLWAPDPNMPGKMKVLYPTRPGQGDYWVLSIDPDYNYVLVGEPKRRQCWMMCRDIKKVNESQVNNMIEKARQLGFEVNRLLKTQHEEIVTGEGSL